MQKNRKRSFNKLNQIHCKLTELKKTPSFLLTADHEKKNTKTG